MVRLLNLLTSAVSGQTRIGLRHSKFVGLREDTDARAAHHPAPLLQWVIYSARCDPSFRALSLALFWRSVLFAQL